MTTTKQIKAYTAVAIKGRKVVGQVRLDGSESISDVVNALRSFSDSTDAAISFENKNGRIVKVVKPGQAS